jgi:hypothetical protein
MACEAESMIVSSSARWLFSRLSFDFLVRLTFYFHALFSSFIFEFLVLVKLGAPYSEAFALF